MSSVSVPPPFAPPPPPVPTNSGSTSGSGGGGGRAIVGGSSVQQMAAGPPPELMRLMESQHRLHQQVSHSQGNMVLPPPPLASGALHCLGPPPVGVHVGSRIVPAPTSVHSASLIQQQHQQLARANALTAQHNQQLSHYLAMQQRGLTPLHVPPGMPPGATAQQLSPQGHSGPLSPAALSATLQRVASPHSTTSRMNGPVPTSSSMNGGAGLPETGGGIHRWFSPDILRAQLPSMPPLPTQGSHIMTVDELERN